MVRNWWWSLVFHRCLTNQNRCWNQSLLFCCRSMLLRTKRRASLSFDDGRLRFHFGVDASSRLYSEATALRIPLTSAAVTWKVHN